MDTASSRTQEARRAPIARTLLTTLLLAALLWAVPPARGARAAGFADPAFRDVWARNDGPVAAGRADRAWTWGPGPDSVPLAEEYREGANGRHLVQYFDKSRMEINDSTGDRAQPWYVTQGLLVSEMIEGRLQTGAASFEHRSPAGVPFGDADDPDGATYASLAGLLSAPAGAVGAPVTAAIDRAGTVGAAPDGGVTCAAVVAQAANPHCVASVFWDYLNSRGPVYAGGGDGDAPLFDPLFYVTGLPLTEAYWAQARVAGAPRTILVQAFERRILTYTPANPAGWRVEQGNVGRHYYRWRYGRELPAPTAMQPGQPPAASGPLGPQTLRVPDDAGATAFAHERTLNVPEGFRVEVYAAGLGGARFLAWSPEGDLLVSDFSGGRVLLLRDRDNDGRADETVTVLSGLKGPHGLAFYGGYLYVAEEGQVARYKWNGGASAIGPAQTVVANLPAGAGHSTRTIVFGPDGKLYLSIGSSCNVCEETDARRAAVLQYNPDGSNERLFASGLRNAVGLAWRPGTSELWASDNGRDNLGNETPIDELNLLADGGNYGWPYCYGSRAADPDVKRDDGCASTTPPALGFPAHSAPLGLAFYTGGAFPAEFKGDLFVAAHGSWNRQPPTGYKLVRVRFGADGKPTGVEDFLTGWLGADGKSWGRPVDPLTGPDGALYLSDDALGVVYRIAFTR